jgi:hypothetical protein
MGWPAGERTDPHPLDLTLHLAMFCHLKSGGLRCAADAIVGIALALLVAQLVEKEDGA